MSLRDYFSNNRIFTGTEKPTQGKFGVGDIIVNIGPNSAEEPMWICVEAGTPGVWELCSGVNEEEIADIVQANAISAIEYTDGVDIQIDGGNIGNMNELQTTDKSSIVGAINELLIQINTLNIKYEEMKSTVDNELQTIACVSLSLNKSTLEINGLDKSEELLATVLPSNCNEKLMWVSSDPNIATVTNGVVTTVNKGSCTIIAICGSKSAQCQLTVINTAGTLISDGVALENDLFGCICTNSSYITFSTSEQCATTRAIGDYQVLELPFSKYFSNLSDITSLNVTAFTKTSVSTVPEVIVGVKSAYAPSYGATNPFLTTNVVKMGEFIKLNGTTTKTEYTIDMTQFHGTSGYLVIGFRLYTSSQTVQMCISDITYS